MASWLLLSVSLAVMAISSVPHGPASVARRSNPCQQSPTQDLLPEVVGPMVGARPAWLVDGSTTWRSSEPVKTLWVLLRTSEEVRIRGRRLDGPGALALLRGDDPPADILLIANPARQSVIPGGAPAAIMRDFAFIPSYVFYPSPGCWEFTVRIGDREVRIVRDLKRAVELDAK